MKLEIYSNSENGTRIEKIPVISADVLENIIEFYYNNDCKVKKIAVFRNDSSTVPDEFIEFE